MKEYNVRNRTIWVCILIVTLLVIDQIIKILVKTNMPLHDSIKVTNWFYISFIENNGMAYGMTFINKVVLSIFRIIVSAIVIVYTFKQIKRHARTLYIILLALIFAGAVGNIFDCMFYGLCFSESTPFQVAQWVPFGEGYGSFLQGRVVDMFYFPIIDTHLPEWIPIWGGDHFIFFSPVFNFADACISVGVVMMLLFCRKELSTISFSKKKTEKEADTEEGEQQSE
ncbi:MAG: lipoprotein signal peptidase [Prevotella sp.]|nr:lipoprotein signal peptidase [Prevotella sp.]